MPCKHAFLEDNLEALVTDSLNSSQQAELNSLLEDCADCAETHRLLTGFSESAQAWQDQSPPNWNRRLFTYRQPSPALSWWNKAALVACTCSLLLVFFNVRVSTVDGFNLEFGQSANQEIIQLLNDQLNAARADNLQDTQSLLTAFSVQQNESRQHLLTQLLAQSRLERQEDLELLNTYWQSQRQADQLEIGQQVNRLADWQFENNRYINSLTRTVSTTTGR